MTTYNNVIYAKTATLGAATVDTINFTSEVQMTVVNMGTTDYIWASGSTTPTVDGDDCVPCPPGCATALPFTGTQLKLISSGTPKYTAIAS